MSPSIGYAVLPILPSMRGVSEAINQQLAGVMPQAGRDAGDQLAGGISQSLSTLGKTVGAVVATGVAAATAAAGTAVVKGWDRLTTIQDASSALEISLGDATAAAVLLDDVLDTVKGTPFNLDQFAAAAQVMGGMGVDAEKIPRYLEAIGEASATQGKRANEFAGRLSSLFGEVSATGQLMMTDVRRMQQVGVDPLRILGNAAETTTAQMQKMISDGAVPAGWALDTLADGILDGSTGINGAVQGLSGTMEKLRENMSGAVAGIEPAMARLGVAVLEPFSPTIVAAANAVTDAIDGLTEKASGWANGLAESEGAREFLDFLTTAPTRIDGVSEKLAEIAPAAGAALAGLTALGTGSIPIIGRFLPAINPVAAAITGLVLATPEARAAIGDLIRDIAPLVGELAEKLAPILVDISELASDVLPPAIGLFGDALKVALGFATGLLAIIEPLTGFLADHSEVVMAVAVAYGAWKAASLGAAAWDGIVKGASAVSGAFQSIGTAMRGFDDISGLSKLGGLLSKNVSAATAFGGALAGIAVGAGVATVALDKLHEAGRESAGDFMSGLNLDTTNIGEAHDALADLNDEIVRLGSQDDGGVVNFFTKQGLRAEVKDLQAEHERLSGALKRTHLGLQNIRDESGLTQEQIEGLADSAGINLLDAFDSAGKPSKELAGELERVAGMAELTGQELEDLEITPEQLAQLEADAKAVEEALQAIEDAGVQAGTAFRSAFDLLSLNDEPVDPKQIEGAEKAVQAAREQVAEAEKARNASGQTADELERSERALAEARDRLSEANQNLQELRDSDSPLNPAKVEAFYADALVSAETFGENYRIAIEAGYDPALMARLLAAGPEEASDLLEVLVSDTSQAFIDMVNDGEAALDEFAGVATEQARLTQMAINDTGETGREMSENLGNAISIATAQMMSDAELSIRDLADITGLSVEEIRRAAGLFEIELEGVKKLVDEILGEITVKTGLSTGQIFGGGQMPQGGRASGGRVWPGTWLVGEEGPELVEIGASGYVYNAAETAALLRRAGAGQSAGAAAVDGGVTLAPMIYTAADAESVGRIVDWKIRGF